MMKRCACPVGRLVHPNNRKVPTRIAASGTRTKPFGTRPGTTDLPGRISPPTDCIGRSWRLWSGAGALALISVAEVVARRHFKHKWVRRPSRASALWDALRDLSQRYPWDADPAGFGTGNSITPLRQPTNDSASRHLGCLRNRMVAQKWPSTVAFRNDSWMVPTAEHKRDLEP